MFKEGDKVTLIRAPKKGEKFIGGWVDEEECPTNGMIRAIGKMGEVSIANKKTSVVYFGETKCSWSYDNNFLKLATSKKKIG